MFVYSSQTDQYPAMAKAIAECYPDVALVGCSAAGVVGGGHEIEHEPALSLTAAVLPGVQVEVFHLLPNEMELLGDEISEENIMTHALGSPSAETTSAPEEIAR